MVQYAVTRKDGGWAVFHDGEPVARDLSRPAAIGMAKSLAFEAGEREKSDERPIQGYFAALSRRLSGGED